MIKLLFTEAGTVRVALRGLASVFVAAVSRAVAVFVVIDGVFLDIDGHACGCRRQQAASLPLEHNAAGALLACVCGTAVIDGGPAPLRLIDSRNCVAARRASASRSPGSAPTRRASKIRVAHRGNSLSSLKIMFISISQTH